MNIYTLVCLLCNGVMVICNSPSAAQLDFKYLQDASKDLKEKTVRLKYSFQDLRDDNEKIAYRIRNLKQYINDIESYYRIENLDILGVPKTRGEDLMGILRNISNALDLPFEESQISAVWRKHEVTGDEENKSESDSIVVRFVSKTVRDEWLKRGRRKITIPSRPWFPDLPESKIYINEHLTKSKKSLIKIAKQLEAEHKIPYAWLKDGNLYIRRTPTGKAIKIRSTHDLKILGLLD